MPILESVLGGWASANEPTRQGYRGVRVLDADDPDARSVAVVRRSDGESPSCDQVYYEEPGPERMWARSRGILDEPP